MDFQPNCDGRKQKLLHSQVYYDKYDFEIASTIFIKISIYIYLYNYILINYRWGLKIKKRMGKVEQWAEKQGLELAAGMYILLFLLLFNIQFD